MGLFSKSPDKHINVPQLDNSILSSPLNGTVVALDQVPDETFATGIMGEGIAIEPSEGALYAPADGVIETVPDTRHAVCMTATNGAELLMHVGRDTVILSGEGFKAFCKQGDKVKCGDLLLTFDMKAIKKAGYLIITPICISNSDEYEMQTVQTGVVTVGTPLLKLTKKEEK